MEAKGATRKRQRVEESHISPPRNKSMFELTQSQIKTTFEEAQAYFSEKGTFQCPFCANHINHNYLQSHIKYCSNLFEQCFASPTRRTSVDRQVLSLYSHEQSSVTTHRIRCLIDGLIKEQAMDTFVSEKLTRAGLRVTFANIKVPSAEAFSKPDNTNESILREEGVRFLFEENYKYNTEAKCYVELESTNDEETVLALYNTFKKNTITVLPKQEVETFIRPNFNWYPDIMSVILSFFQSPPENTKGFHQTNSYVQLFSEFPQSSSIDFLNPSSFYFLQLAIRLENCYYSLLPLKWKSNKRIAIAALESQSKSTTYAKILSEIPSALQQDIDVLVAMSLRDPRVFSRIPKDKIDKNFILHCLHYGCPSSIAEYFPTEFFSDGEIVLQLVQRNPKSFESYSSPKVSEKAFAEEEITSQILAINGYLLRFAPNDVKKNRRLVLIAVKQNGKSLQYVDDSLVEDKEVVLTAVQQAGSALEFASEKLREDKQVVITAIQNDPVALHFALSTTLQQDEELIQLANTVKKQMNELNRPLQLHERTWYDYRDENEIFMNMDNNFASESIAESVLFDLVHFYDLNEMLG